MDLKKAESMAVKLMGTHGLIDKGWTFSFDNAKKRYGCCRYSRKSISLSSPLTEIREKENVKNTILHEIAHALVGSGHNHDSVWKTKAMEIGCNGNRCSSDVSLKGNWIGECPNGHLSYRHRKPRRRISCGVCFPNIFNEQFILKFKKHENNN